MEAHVHAHDAKGGHSEVAGADEQKDHDSQTQEQATHIVVNIYYHFGNW